MEYRHDDAPFGTVQPTGRGTEVALVAPLYCREGHRLGPGQVSVAYLPCSCTAEGGHSTFRCRTCDDVQHFPAHDGQPRGMASTYDL